MNSQMPDGGYRINYPEAEKTVKQLDACCQLLQDDKALRAYPERLREIWPDATGQAFADRLYDILMEIKVVGFEVGVFAGRVEDSVKAYKLAEQQAPS